MEPDMNTEKMKSEIAGLAAGLAAGMLTGIALGTVIIYGLIFR